MFDKLLKKYGGSLKLSGKLFIIAFLLVFIFGSVAWWASQWPVDVESLPIQIITESGHGAVATLSKAEIRDYPSGFRNFVTAVTEHIAIKLAQERLPLNNAQSKERSLLQFVVWHVAYPDSRSAPSVSPLKAQPFGVCRIYSPWIDLVIQGGPVPSVRGIVRYSERQLLADQAMLAGAGNVPLGVARPLTEKEFMQYAFAYADSEITLTETTTKPIEERVPSDLLWLFRHAGQTTTIPFDNVAYADMGLAMKQGADGYTQIVIRLVDRCFASAGRDIHYDSILDTADLVPLEQYKIGTLNDLKTGIANHRKTAKGSNFMSFDDYM